MWDFLGSSSLSSGFGWRVYSRLDRRVVQKVEGPVVVGAIRFVSTTGRFLRERFSTE